MLLIQCNGCKDVATTEGYTNPDAALSCGCCPEDHDHAAAANSCDGSHKGDCHVSNKDCPVCRSVTITVLPGSVQMQHAIGG